MSSKDIFLSIILVLVLGAIAVAMKEGLGVEHDHNLNDDHHVTNFEECVAAGNPVMESYPRQCRTKDGRLFVEEVAMQVPNPPQGVVVGEGCAIGGCSAQLCGEEGEIENVATTCEWQPQYACYQNATCERQADGQCGWTETTELQQCLSGAEATSTPSVMLEVEARN